MSNDRMRDEERGAGGQSERIRRRESPVLESRFRLKHGDIIWSYCQRGREQPSQYDWFQFPDSKHSLVSPPGHFPEQRASLSSLLRFSWGNLIVIPLSTQSSAPHALLVL